MNEPEPTQEDLETFLSDLSKQARADLIPKMRQSFMCLSILTGDFDIKLALEVGVAMLLDKPLVILAIGRNVFISPRLRQFADVVIEGEVFDQPMKAKATAAIEALLRRKRSFQ